MTRYPEIEPYDTGMLSVGDGQQLYWETCGNPDGKPALVLHGGPGSGCTPGHRRYFDPAKYQIVLFDQRGAGRSTPRVTATTDLSANTTDHLIADIELLRAHFGINRWLVWGNSWGVTLGLAYAQRHPTRVSEMVLAAVTMTRPQEIHWLYHTAAGSSPRTGSASALACRRPRATATWWPPTTVCSTSSRMCPGASRPRVTGARGRTP